MPPDYGNSKPMPWPTPSPPRWSRDGRSRTVPATSAHVASVTSPSSSPRELRCPTWRFRWKPPVSPIGPNPAPCSSPRLRSGTYSWCCGPSTTPLMTWPSWRHSARPISAAETTTSPAGGCNMAAPGTTSPTSRKATSRSSSWPPVSSGWARCTDAATSLDHPGFWNA